MENNNHPKGNGFFSKDGKLNKFLNKYGVVAALAGCALVVGATWYFGYADRGNPDATLNPIEAPSAKPIENNLSENLENIQTKTPAPTVTPSATQAPQGGQSSAKPGGDAPASAPSLVRPVAGDIIQKYAIDELVYNKTLNQWSTHSGVDIACQEGDDVVAALKGTVARVYEDALMGKCVLLKYDDSVFHLYCGLLSTESLHEGQEFLQGQTIGQAGGTIPCESLSGVHIHFELIENNVAKDPTTAWK